MKKIGIITTILLTITIGGLLLFNNKVYGAEHFTPSNSDLSLKSLYIDRTYTDYDLDTILLNDNMFNLSNNNQSLVQITYELDINVKYNSFYVRNSDYFFYDGETTFINFTYDSYGSDMFTRNDINYRYFYPHNSSGGINNNPRSTIYTNYNQPAELFSNMLDPNDYNLNLMTMFLVIDLSYFDPIEFMDSQALDIAENEIFFSTDTYENLMVNKYANQDTSDVYNQGYDDAKQYFGKWSNNLDRYITADDYGLIQYDNGYINAKEWYGIYSNGAWLRANAWGDIRYGQGLDASGGIGDIMFSITDGIFNTIGLVFGIQLLPGFSIGNIALVFLAFGVLAWFIGKRGGGD